MYLWRYSECKAQIWGQKNADSSSIWITECLNKRSLVAGRYICTIIGAFCILSGLQHWWRGSAASSFGTITDWKLTEVTPLPPQHFWCSFLKVEGIIHPADTAELAWSIESVQKLHHRGVQPAVDSVHTCKRSSLLYLVIWRESWTVFSRSSDSIHISYINLSVWFFWTI